MKLTQYKKVTLITILLIAAINSVLYAQAPVNTNIVGTWISIEDEEHKLVFDENNTLQIFINDVLEIEYNYEVSGNDCTGSNSPISITYLKYVDDEGDEYCNEVSVRNDHMAIISYPRALISEYTRQ